MYTLRHDSAVSSQAQSARKTLSPHVRRVNIRKCTFEGSGLCSTGAVLFKMASSPRTVDLHDALALGLMTWEVDAIKRNSQPAASMLRLPFVVMRAEFSQH